MSSILTYIWLIFYGKLVGDFNPSEKYARQIGSFPQIGMKIKIFQTSTQYLMDLNGVSGFWNER